MFKKLGASRGRVALQGCLILGLSLVVLLSGCGSQPAQPGTTSSTANAKPNLEKSVALLAKVKTLKSPDGQPLILDTQTPTPPPRPANPDALPKTDFGHWWDMQYSYAVDKVNIPKSPGNGSIGKKVILLEPGPHPYWTAYTKGSKAVAEALGMDWSMMLGNATAQMQMQQVDEAIAKHPDLIIIAPVDPASTLRELRKINQAGIPVIVSNLQADREAMKYAITYTGPSIWNQTILAADALAKKMNYEGDYALIRHMPGWPTYWGRTYGYVDELAKVAPKMHLLAMQTADLDPVKTDQLVSQWLTQYGSKLKGIGTADDSGTIVGAEQALQAAHRNDVVMVATGNSKTGMDFIKSGVLYANTYQSAQGDGALAAYEAARWFDGKNVPQACFLKDILITKDNVDSFLPAQW